jgi:hypothetical protein
MINVRNTNVIAATTALACAAALAAGCGGDSSSPASKTASAGTGVMNPGTAAPAPNAKRPVVVHRAKPAAPAPAHSERATGATSKVSSGHRPVQRAKVEESAKTETGTTGTPGTDPCKLVTKAEAGAILGKQIAKMISAPQGPTCIYQPSGGKATITLAVDSTNIAAARKGGKTLSQSKVQGHTALCVDYGSVKMLVPLTGGRVLNVTAPCQLAAGFAAKALQRVG